MLGKLLVAGTLGAGIAFIVPMRRERAPNDCTALARQVLAGHASATPAPDPVTAGAIAAALARARYPGVPPQLVCAAAYWGVVLDPTLRRPLRRLAGRPAG
jgi:hypothetical protein